MASEGVPEELEQLVQKMHNEYTKSEVQIALALAEADGALSIPELADVTGYTERTIKKRVRTLEEALGGSPLISRTDADEPILHEEVARALLAFASEE